MGQRSTRLRHAPLSIYPKGYLPAFDLALALSVVVEPGGDTLRLVSVKDNPTQRLVVGGLCASAGTKLVRHGDVTDGDDALKLVRSAEKKSNLVGVHLELDVVDENITVENENAFLAQVGRSVARDLDVSRLVCRRGGVPCGFGGNDHDRSAGVGDNRHTPFVRGGKQSGEHQ